jgi:uncharacterized protein (UPF0147 family)
MEELEEIKGYLKEMIDDASIPKNVRVKSQEVLDMLNGEGDLSISASKALNIFEELSEDTNIDAFVRTQIWNIVSLLEKVA